MMVADIQSALEKINAISGAEIACIINSIPSEWEVPDAAKNALCCFLTERARWLSAKDSRAFQNGCMNLVTPEILSPNESRAMNRTEKLAIEGDLIQRHVTPDGMRRKIIAVLKLPEEGLDNSAMGRITNFLGEYNIRVLKVCQIGELEREISAHGH